MTMYDGQEDLDDLVWDRNDELTEHALKQMRHKSVCRKVEQLVEENFCSRATLVSPLIGGGFNMLYRIHVEDRAPDIMVRLPCSTPLFDSLVRLPCSTLIQFPKEKTEQEAATAALIAKETQLPIPQLHFYGKDSPAGPYIMMDRVEMRGSVSSRLTKPSEDASDPHSLDPEVDGAVLDTIWGQISRCYLQIHQLTFPRVGSLLETSPGCYEVAGRPITHNMNDMVRLANVPRSVLPPDGTTYETATAWYTALAEMHIAQLLFQHNDAVVSADDCKNKYVARQIFRRLAIQGRLSTFGFSDDTWSAQSFEISPSTLLPAPSDSQDFRLWGDDFRAGNILLNETDDIAALIDWEFACAGPTQFSLDAPWWLLLETIEMWSDGMDDWRKTYSLRLKAWLAAMSKAEAETGPQASTSQMPGPLSAYMEQSWETGRFFLSYASRKSWAFDAVYWRYLDERFFGRRDPDKELWETRLHLLSDAERLAMGPFVERNLAEADDRRIVDWEPNEAKNVLSQMLFNNST